MIIIKRKNALCQQRLSPIFGLTTLSRTVRFFLSMILVPILLFIACNDREEDSPFTEILSQPPYAAITDSIKRQPKNDELYFRRAVLLNRNNLPEPALADFKKAWSISKQEKYAFGVTNSYIEKKPDSAIAFLKEALPQLPKSFLLRLSLARAYDATGKTDDALQVCNEILQVVPDEVDVLILKSELLDKKNDSLGSAQVLEKALLLVPRNFDLGFRLAYKYAENKNPKAISLCDTLLIRDSLKFYAEPYYIKGIYYANIGDKNKAIQSFDETIRHSYNFLNAYIEKGKILVDQKKNQQAFSVFQLANTIKPAFPDAYYWMGVCQEAMGQKEDARLNYEKAVALDKTFTEAKEAADRLNK